MLFYGKVIHNLMSLHLVMVGLFIGYLWVINSLIIQWGQKNAAAAQTIELPISYTTNYINILSHLTTGYAGTANISPVNIYANTNTLSSFQVFIDNAYITGMNWMTIGY